MTSLVQTPIRTQESSMDTQHPAIPLRALANQSTVRLTTFRRDGTPVNTPVNLAVDGDHVYFRTWDTSGKAKRLRRDQAVEIAPCTFLGRPTGPAIAGRANRVDGATAERACRLIEAKHPILQGFLVHHGHRLTGRRAVY
jgi:PPOX class probable F420-dependent enzyme